MRIVGPCSSRKKKRGDGGETRDAANGGSEEIAADTGVNNESIREK